MQSHIQVRLAGLCSKQNNAPQGCLLPNSWHPGDLGDYGTSCGFKNVAGVLKDFEIRRLFWSFQMGPKCNHQGPYKRYAEQAESEGDVRMEVGVREGLGCPLEAGDERKPTDIPSASRSA